MDHFQKMLSAKSKAEAETAPGEPVSGFQLIGTYGDHDRVLRYVEKEEDLDQLYRVAAAKRLEEPLSREEELMLRDLRSWPERLDFDALSIQACDGTVLREDTFVELDASPSGLSI